MKLAQKTAVITGAARGIGFCIAKRFLEEGAKVAIFDVLEKELSEAKSRLSQYEGKVLNLKVDVTSAESVKLAIDTVEKELGPVDILVNNAGITRDAMLHKMDDTQWQQVIDVNLKGVFICGRETGSRMRERGSGVILNTSSVVGVFGNVGQSNYAATKAGVIAMTKTWAKELGRREFESTL